MPPHRRQSANQGKKKGCGSTVLSWPSTGKALDSSPVVKKRLGVGRAVGGMGEYEQNVFGVPPPNQSSICTSGEGVPPKACAHSLSPLVKILSLPCSAGWRDRGRLKASVGSTGIKEQAEAESRLRNPKGLLASEFNVTQCLLAYIEISLEFGRGAMEALPSGPHGKF